MALDDQETKVYTLTAAQADEGEGTKNLKLRNVKGQGGVSAYAIPYDTCLLQSENPPFFRKLVLTHASLGVEPCWECEGAGGCECVGTEPRLSLLSVPSGGFAHF